MYISNYNDNFVPISVPMKNSGKLTSKIIIKKDYQRVDGTCALFLQIYLNGERRRLPLGISVPLKNFNEKKQRVNNNKDFNLLIEKALSDIHQIELAYRLRNQILTIDTLIKEYENPSPRIDFLKFYEVELINQKKIIKKSSWRQQNSVLNKLKNWKHKILFQDITEQLIKELNYYLINELGNAKLTTSTTLKNFKKYLHIANKRGIYSPLRFSDIKVPHPRGQRTYLTIDEVKRLIVFYESIFINEVYKNVLARFLFSCFTGLRISDIKNISAENIIDNTLVFTAVKTGKFQRIKLNNNSMKFIDISEKELFTGDYSEQHINRILKEIAKVVGIKKNISFHVSRHTFATMFLLKGGNVVVLQRALGHSNINDTMIYVHIVDAHLNDQMLLLDDL